MYMQVSVYIYIYNIVTCDHQTSDIGSVHHACIKESSTNRAQSCLTYGSYLPYLPLSLHPSIYSNLSLNLNLYRTSET